MLTEIYPSELEHTPKLRLCTYSTLGYLRWNYIAAVHLRPAFNIPDHPMLQMIVAMDDMRLSLKEHITCQPLPAMLPKLYHLSSLPL